MLSLPVFALVITILANLGLAITIVVSLKKQKYKFIFLIVLLTVILWAIGDLMILFSRSETYVYLGAKLFYISPVYTVVFLWLFSIIFPDNKTINKKYSIIAIISLIIPTTLLLLNLELIIKPINITNSLNISTPNNPGFILYSLLLTTFFATIYLTLIKKLIRLKGVEKLQVTYVFTGVSISSGLALVTNLLLPLVGVKEFIWLGPLFTLINTVTMFMAMYKYQLFEFKTVLIRLFSYSLFIILVGIAYSTAVTIVSRFISRDLGLFTADFYISIVAMLIVAFTFSNLRFKINSWTNAVFFQDQYDPQASLNELNAGLVSSSSINNLINSSISSITKTLRPVNRGIVIDGENNKYLSSEININELYQTKISNILKARIERTIAFDKLGTNDHSLRKFLLDIKVSLITKLTVQDKIVGFIILGERKNGSPYSEKDIQFIETAADSIAIATQNALRYEEIAAFNANLQKKIDIATADLRKTNEKLKALDEAKDDFISMASHQLRTPLTSVKGYLSMVLEGDAGPINDLQRKFLSQSFISSQRMVFLISDLLNASRLKTGKFVIENKETYIPDIVGEELSQLEETIKARGLTLEYKKPKSFPVVNIDENKIRQVIMNFVDNAIYYTPSGGKIVVKLRATHEVIEYTVQDSGIGVPKEDQKHLFTKFYRAGNAKKARPDGTGLGIFMAKKVIIAQGGALIFKSEEGKGSVFGFSFPLKKIKIK